MKSLKFLSRQASMVLCLALVGVATSSSKGRAQGVELDASAYRYDSSNVLVETYFGVLQRQLPFVQNGDMWIAPINAKIEISENGKVVGSQSIVKSVAIKGTQAQFDSASANKAVHGAAFTVPYSNNATVALIWISKSPKGETSFDTITKTIALPDNNTSHFTLSSIELASSVVKADGSSSPFEKVGYIVTPNPSDVYGELYTKLYYYLELYIPKNVVDPSQSVEILSRILDGGGNEITSSVRTQQLLNTTLPYIGSMDVDGLPPDAYKLDITVKRQGAIEAHITKPFYFENGIKLSEEEPTVAPAVADEQAIFNGSDIKTFSEATLDEKFQQAKYVASAADNKSYSKLQGVDAKRAFFFKFWRMKDAEGQQPLSFYKTFYKRVEEANKKFSSMKTPGWKSDRGRIWIVYGPFTRDDRYFGSTGGRDYMFWWYEPPDKGVRMTDGSSKAYFIFIDLQGGGNFRLENSNVVGEIQNPNWRNEVSRIQN